ncbi:MAG: hypothetical protein COA66_07855 [Arcobacter sp.]|nr:MAG: hypothetical protein COA66_07855 [Arcobacter sp.]
MNSNTDKQNIQSDVTSTLNVERAVLSSFLFNSNTFDKMHDSLKPETFFMETHQMIFKSMLKLHKEEKPIDEEFIKKDINDSRHENVLIDILSANPITNLSAYIKSMQEDHIKREMLRISSSLAQNARTTTLSASSGIEKLNSELLKLNNLYKTKNKKSSNKMEIDVSKFTPFIKSIVQDLAQINDYPISMVLSTVLTSMGGLIGGRAQITNNVNLTVYPIIWSIVIAPSSAGAKSTLYKYTKKCIFGNLQTDFYDEYEKKTEQYELDKKNFRELSKDDKKNEIEPDKPEPKLLIFQNDGTPEAKIKSLQENQNGGIIYYDEMRSELERTNNDRSYKATKTSIFDVELIHKRLVNGGSIIVKRPVLSEIGLITEQWLLEATNKNDIASGFMARYLFSYNIRADFKPLQIKPLHIKTSIYEEVGNFVINMLEFDRKEPVLFKLSKEAENHFTLWFNEYSESAHDTETDEELTATYRLSTYALKFALMSYIFNNAYEKLDVVNSKLIEIPLEYIEEGIFIMNIFTEESNKVLQLFQKNKLLNFKIDSVAEKLLKKIRATKEKRITKSSATNNIRGLNKEKIDELIEQGIFKLEKVEKTTFIIEC